MFELQENVCYGQVTRKIKVEQNLAYGQVHYWNYNIQSVLPCSNLHQSCYSMVVAEYQFVVLNLTSLFAGSVCYSNDHCFITWIKVLIIEIIYNELYACTSHDTILCVLRYYLFYLRVSACMCVHCAWCLYGNAD